ncbi:hypothetical protein U9M48_035920, partial [Paspalum notatum var. saurae]
MGAKEVPKGMVEEEGLPLERPGCGQWGQLLGYLGKVWTWVLQRLQLPVVVPSVLASRFNSWWFRASRTLPKELRKGFNSLVVLVSWELWKHRNACVFEGASPDLQTVLHSVAAKGHLWCLSGASAFQDLVRVPASYPLGELRVISFKATRMNRVLSPFRTSFGANEMERAHQEKKR